MANAFPRVRSAWHLLVRPWSDCHDRHIRRALDILEGKSSDWGWHFTTPRISHYGRILPRCRAVMMLAPARGGGAAAGGHAIIFVARLNDVVGVTCTLQALLDDPVTRLVMRADHVSETALLDLVCAVSVARTGLQG
jgi:hypothetical protein